MQAWDTLFWFAVLVGMSGQLNGLGVIKYFADSVGGALIAMNLGWQPVFALLNAAYFGLHYMFASQTAHVGALYAAFLAMMLSAGKLRLSDTVVKYDVHWCGIENELLKVRGTTAKLRPLRYSAARAGVPGVLGALSLAYVSNLFGSMTHYGSGQAAVYYGAGYVSLQEVFSIGGVMVVVNALLWAVAGSIWWKLCGFY
jgi:DASS family divalent anion:Na+ symporter